MKPRKWAAIGPYSPTKFVILGGEDMDGEEFVSKMTWGPKVTHDMIIDVETWECDNEPFKAIKRTCLECFGNEFYFRVNSSRDWQTTFNSTHFRRWHFRY